MFCSNGSCEKMFFNNFIKSFIFQKKNYIFVSRSKGGLAPLFQNKRFDNLCLISVFTFKKKLKPFFNLLKLILNSKSNFMKNKLRLNM